ncbi:uncharacterized protein LOC144906312 [Branchiostoma floridae x Branchiostoma belcheri]
MAKVNTKLSTVVDEFRKLDLIFKSGSDLDVVERGYARKLVHAISSQNEVLECEALKGLGDLYLHKAKMNTDKVENFHKACSMYTELLRYYTGVEEKQVVQHRIKYAEKCTKLVHDQDILKARAASSSNTILAVSMTLHEMKKKTKVKVYGVMPLIEGYTDSLVKAIAEGNKRLEIESLKSIGDLYLEKGRDGKDEAALAKSAGLYRAALDRSEDSDDRETLGHRIKYAEKVKETARKKAKKRPETKPLRSKKGGTTESQPAQERGDVISRRNYGRIQFGEGGAQCDTSSEKALEATDSTYDEELREGCRSLQTGDLDTAEQHFAAALKAVHLKDPKAGEHWKETKPLYKLSDVYVKKGKKSKDGGDFTKAAALSNAALVRANVEDKEDIKETSLKITQSFANHVLNTTKPVPIDDVEKHKSVLTECRRFVEEEIKRIEQQIDPYSLDDSDPKIREVEKKRVEAIKALFDTIVHKRLTFITGLVHECMEVMGPPPCKYAMIGLGSQATGLVTPYSDLEFAMLIERDTENNVKYFHNLTHYLHLKVINLGETILPAMAIKSLNDFESDDKLDSWFYDSVTPCGFSFDGAMPHACKTPLGRGKTCHLIRTPRDMAKVLEDDVTLHLKKGYHLASVLGTVSLITGNQDLVDEYNTAWDQQLKKNGSKIAKLIANIMLMENIQTFAKHDPTARMLDVKKEIYRFSSIAVSCWALLCDIQPTTIWETIQKMHEKGTICDENAHHLMVLVSISAELRLRTYMNNRGQVENMSVLSSVSLNDDIEDRTKKIFHFSNVKQLMRYYYTATPLKYFVPELSNHQPLEQPSVLYDNSLTLQASVYESLYDYNNSKACTEQQLRKELSRHGESIAHPDIASSLHNLGDAWSHLGDHRKAVSYYEQALQMMRRIVGDGTAHPDIATSLDNLGAAWSGLGDRRKAAIYHEQALEMRRRIHGEGIAHPDNASSLNNLGNAWYHLGDYRKAVNYYEQALQMKRRIHGKSVAHPDVASSLINLGNAWGNLGDYRKAVSCYERALQMVQSVYGKGTSHPDIAGSLSNLGTAWIHLGDHRKAVSYHEQSLQMRRSIYGKGIAHPDIASSLNNLGAAWSNLDDYRKAVSYYEQALQMEWSIHGKGVAHPDVAASLNNLGTAWINLGDYRKAVSYCKQALQMSRSVNGKSTAHPDIASSLHNLGAVWSDLGDYRKSVSYYEQALQMRRNIYGKSIAHPDIALSLSNLGNTWLNLGDHRKAISCHEQALQMRRSIYGKGNAHPNIASSLDNLGNAWGNLGDYRKAASYHEQALQMWRGIYDEDNTHPHIAGSLNGLGIAWGNLGDYRKAVRYFEQALQMMQSIYGEGMAHPNIASSHYNLVKGIVEGNKRLEIESLKSIGDLYIEKGRDGKDEAALAKSGGLYRAALDRCEDSDGRETLRHRIKYTEKVEQTARKKAKKRVETKPLRNKKGVNESQLASSPMSAQESRDVIVRKNYGRMTFGEGGTRRDNSSEKAQEGTDCKYGKELREGCRALQTGDLDTAEQHFAAALKYVHLKDPNAGEHSHLKETKPLCKLSDVYVKKGKKSKDGGDFTKAAALSNATLVRAKMEDREDIKQTILKITQSFANHVLNTTKPMPIDDVVKHKSALTECRDYVEREIKRIEQQIDPYALDDSDPKIREVEKKRVEAIKALFDTIVHQRRTFITGLVDECIGVMGPPPCKYAMIGLGSHATGLVTPYSDLEFAILIEKETENSVKYFHNLTHYLHLKVINLGETILPAMAIKSLNDFESDDKLDSWFYDSVTPRGFSFDGAMPHASNHNLGDYPEDAPKGNNL